MLGVLRYLFEQRPHIGSWVNNAITWLLKQVCAEEPKEISF